MHKSKATAPTWLLIGPLPSPVTGQSIAFQSLVESMPPEAVRVVDFSFRGSGRLRQVVHWLRVLAECVCLMFFSRRHVYLTIAQSTAGFLRDAPILLTATLLRRKTICHLHGGNYDQFYASQGRVLRALIRFTLERVDGLIVLSEQLRGMFAFDMRLQSKLIVLENGLPYPDDLTICAPSLPKDDAGPLRLLFLSNMIPTKGYQVLADALLQLKCTQAFPFTCEFCGTFYSLDDSGRIWKDKAAERHFLEWINANGLQDEVRYRGEVSGEEKLEVLCEAQVLILPTSYANEGQPLCIIEALAFGNVVIATDYRAISDLVVHGETGLLIPGGNVTALIAAITQLARDRQRLSEMGVQARERYLERFTYARHIHSLHELLELTS